ncbi:hypothetical protein HPB49_010300 [Dermacentor silvarum]|uniref:Uncharacterized protein n=1 Tax=Dermacentor silvarum TaxID=543639 RepID=A0ACB8CWK2_DERSI|nr:hypothetical protein HPB49_010300 [Dermacentor silvarum]
MAAAADEIAVLLQAAIELLDAYEAIEEERDEVDEHAINLLVARFVRQDRHRVPLYVERVVPAYMDMEFKKMFRLSRSSVAAVVEEFEKSAFYPQGGYLIGDCAYPLLVWLQTPYRQCGASWQPWMEAFNATHCKQRVVIEGAFGLLKARFRRLAYVDVATIPQAVDIVMAACVLHNIASRSGDAVDDEEQVDSGTNVLYNDPDSGVEASVLATTVRDTIAQAL